ncbi:MAG: hypothetical protein NC041_08440 [Bacteroides sp.]|nr:hypothetical protein [Prevotella sp.]MCM1408289.1 hypothetical protein [Treponema brennaborense]MCM1470479.1 hypothetical protein [Bacteroides sp.]
MKQAALSLALFCLICCSRAAAEIKYIEIKDVANISEIEFSNLSDFEKFATGDIFFCKKTSKSYVLVGSTYYSYNLQGYRTVADFKAGSEYKNAGDYYESAEQKIPDAERFYFYKSNHFANGADALDAWANGWAEKFERANYAKFEEEEIYLGGSISESYYSAKEKGINTLPKYIEFLFLQKHGFSSMEVYKTAKSKGFNENSDYQNAAAKGFETKEVWDTARKLNLADSAEYRNYIAFTAEIEKRAGEKNVSKKEAVVYHYLLKVPKDSYSLEKLIENLKTQIKAENINVKRAIEEYVGERYRNNYGNNFTEMENYLSSSLVLEIIGNSKELGKYNEKTDVFNKK